MVRPSAVASTRHTPSWMKSVQKWCVRSEHPLESWLANSNSSGSPCVFLPVLSAVESAAVSAVAWSCGRCVWMVVRFVCVIRVPRTPVCPVCVPAPPGVFLPVRVRPCVPCVPCVSRLPPVSFYRYRYSTSGYCPPLPGQNSSVSRLTERAVAAER